MLAYRCCVACGPQSRWPLRLLVTTALVAATALTVVAPAWAQSATWNLFAGSGDFNTTTNWTPTTVPTDTAFFGTTNVTSLTLSADTTVGGWTFKTGAPSYDFSITQTLDFTGAGIVVLGGSATIMNFNNITFQNTSAAGSAVITSQLGAVNFHDTSSAGTATITNVPGGSLFFRNAATAGSATILNLWFTEFSGTSSAGNATVTSNGAIDFRDASTAGSATITNGGSIDFLDTSSAGSSTITNNNFLRFLGGSTAENATITNNDDLQFTTTSTAGNATIINNNTTVFVDFATGGTARFINVGMIDLSQLSSTGITAGSIEGGGAIFLGSKNLAVGGNNLSTTYSGVLQDDGILGGVGGSLTKVGAGTLTLTGVNTYTGSTTVDGGALLVNGSTAASALTVVNAGGTLGGTGTIGNTTVTGGMLAPGTSIGTLTVQGSLAFTAAATYLVEISPSNADRTNVNGAATLAGTVNAVFAPGSYIARNYTILSTAGGLGGSQFNALATANLPVNFTASLRYSGNDVLLDLTAALGLGAGLNRNQQNVANAINNFFNGGGALPPAFATMFGLTGPALGNALTQLSGEVATGAQQASAASTGLFLNMMLDPFVTGRSGGFGPGLSFAPQTQPSRVQLAAQDAFAAALPVKALPPGPASERRWSVWGAAYGGRNRTDGIADVGSNDLSATAAGFAMGADYRHSPDTVLGLATAIGETRWSVAGAGKGNADVAQFGGYASTRWNSFYLSGAVAAAWYRASTDRTVTIAGTDRLEADFNANSLAGRVEGGRRFGGMLYGFAPYAALQVQSVHTAAYSEVATAGSNQFALAYTAQTATDNRSEFGFWADHRRLLASGATLVLRGRAAWVHDFNPGARVNATFQTLPGASFTVDGAQAPRDSALTSAVAELRMTNGVILVGKVDSEFSGRSHTIAGTGTMRYAW